MPKEAMTKETKNSIYRDLSRKLINMTMGDKVKIDGLKKYGEGEDKIELKPPPKDKVKPTPSSPQQIIFNLLSSIILIIACIIGLFIPIVVCTVYTISETQTTLHGSSIVSLQDLLNLMEPLVRFYFNNIVFTILVMTVTFIIIGALFIIKNVVDIIEMSILKKIFVKYYNKTADKLKSLDNEERLRKEEAK
jgi:magnesium-transporting ATPase (P-type)